jgi:predicted dehydrogenase
MRNWYYFTWLSGDHIVEQHCHNFDKACWVLGQYPIAATGLGGRQVRTDAKYGNIFDHHSVIFEYANGVRVFSFCRQMANCKSEVSDHVLGAKGTAELQSHTVRANGASAWKYQGEETDMYDQEHIDLFKSIRKGEPLNDGESAALSSLMGIMGRTATYTGQRVTWDFMLKQSNETLTPPVYDWTDVPAEFSKIAIPGTSKLV